jgi:hypothetical protein
VLTGWRVAVVAAAAAFALVSGAGIVLGAPEVAAAPPGPVVPTSVVPTTVDPTTVVPRTASPGPPLTASVDPPSTSAAPGGQPTTTKKSAPPAVPATPTSTTATTAPGHNVGTP